MHIQRHTHTSTHAQSAHKRIGDNQAQEPGWEGRKKGFVWDLAHTQKQNQEKSIFTNLKKRFEHIELPAKLLDYFLRRNKSNINQSKQVFRIFDPGSIHQLEPHGFKTPVFLVRRQPQNFENVTFVARRREHFQFFFDAELPQKRGCFDRER